MIWSLLSLLFYVLFVVYTYRHIQESQRQIKELNARIDRQLDELERYLR